jgi:hypothetical protein
MAPMKMWYVPSHSFSFINYVHAHYIYKNIDSSFENFVIENKFKNKLRFPIGIALLSMWIL